MPQLRLTMLGGPDKDPQIVCRRCCFCHFVILSFCLLSETCIWRGRRCWAAGRQWGWTRWGKSQSGLALSGIWSTFTIRINHFLWLDNLLCQDNFLWLDGYHSKWANHDSVTHKDHTLGNEGGVRQSLKGHFWGANIPITALKWWHPIEKPHKQDFRKNQKISRGTNTPLHPLTQKLW